MVKAKSVSFSFKGWNFESFAQGLVGGLANKDNLKKLKEVCKWAAPQISAWLVLNKPEIAIPAGILGKAALDLVEYFIKKR